MLVTNSAKLKKPKTSFRKLALSFSIILVDNINNNSIRNFKIYCVYCVCFLLCPIVFYFHYSFSTHRHIGHIRKHIRIYCVYCVFPYCVLCVFFFSFQHIRHIGHSKILRQIRNQARSFSLHNLQPQQQHLRSGMCSSWLRFLALIQAMHCQLNPF